MVVEDYTLYTSVDITPRKSVIAQKFLPGGFSTPWQSDTPKDPSVVNAADYYFCRIQNFTVGEDSATGGDFCEGRLVMGILLFA